MPVMMIMRWEGVTAEEYHAVCKEVDFERVHPQGGLFHVAAVDAKGLYVTDVWESAEDFSRFVESRLMPGVAKVGIRTQPQVQVLQAEKVFAPGYTRKA